MAVNIGSQSSNLQSVSCGIDSKAFFSHICPSAPFQGENLGATRGEGSRGVTEHGASLVEKPVGDLMTRSAVRCGPDDSIVDVLSLMHNHDVRHLPVMDRDDVVGIISLRDVTTHWLNALEEENVTLRKILSNTDLV